MGFTFAPMVVVDGGIEVAVRRVGGAFLAVADGKVLTVQVHKVVADVAADDDGVVEAFAADAAEALLEVLLILLRR